MILPRSGLGDAPPRFESVPPHVASSGQDAIDLAAAAGLILDPWQQRVLRGALGEDDDGLWTAFEVGLVVPRQNGKGAILEARVLAGLFLFETENLILYSAHEFKTAQEAFKRIQALIRGCPDLMRAVKQIHTANGNEGIELKNGCRLRIVARSVGSGRGFSSDLVIMDEAYELGPDQMAAMMPTMSGRPNPQLWYTSSAGRESSSQLRLVRERGITGLTETDLGLAYYEWSADPRADLDDQDVWAAANPALGVRITEKFVVRERAAMPEMEFGRERLGIWDDGARVAVIPFDVWAGLIDRTSAPLDPVTFAVDVSPDRSSASIAAVGRRLDGKWHVEVIENLLGTAWVVNRLVDLSHRWTPAGVICDPAGPVGSLIPALTEAGVAVTTITTRELGQACGGFYDAALGNRMVHIDQPVLTAAVHTARRRPLGDAWAWHRRDSATDISPLVACTLAMFGHARFAAEPRRTPGRSRVLVLE